MKGGADAGARGGDGVPAGAAAAIAWIGPADGGGQGCWGLPDQLSLPLNDRGLLLADGLFETVLVQMGRPQLLEPHVQRWREGARRLGMAPPPDLGVVQQLAAEAVRRSGIRTGALRLNWSRGSGGRGLELPPAGQAGRFWLQLTACLPGFTPVRVIVSPTERRCATSELSRLKTFAYGSAIQARRQARAAGAEDALLQSTAGGLCCGTAANLLLWLEGRWWTPALASGCLPGVMRRRALERGLVAEADAAIGPEALADGTVRAALLLNSLGCRPISHCDGVALAGRRAAPLMEGLPVPAGMESGAEAFWRALL